MKKKYQNINIYITQKKPKEKNNLEGKDQWGLKAS